MNKIEENVIKRIIPSNIYRNKVNDTIKNLKIKLEEEIKKRELPVEIELVGSIAKDTYLQDNMDIDFFLKYPTIFSKDKIARNTLSIGNKILEDTEESYAEHPYLRGYFQGFNTEIVPCYKIENAKQKLSAVDRTPLHTTFVKQNLKEKQKNQVRLLKQFLKGVNCYGAEAQIEGFSGYLCEILIIKFKSFRNLIESGSKWKMGEKLSIRKGKFPDFNSALTFIDPVDRERNVAAAVSDKKFILFKKACKQYLKKPKITFFFPNKIKTWSLQKIKNELKKQDALFFGIRFKKPNLIDENLYPQIRKAMMSIYKTAKRADFKIYDMDYYTDKKQIIIIVKSKKTPLPKTKLHTGPPISAKKNAKEFRKKWEDHPDIIKGPFEKENRLYVEIKREFIDLREFINYKIKDLSLGKHLEKTIKNQYEILDIQDLVNQELQEYWTKYLDNKMSWDR